MVNEDSIPPGLICPYCHKKAMSVFDKLFLIPRGLCRCKNCKNIIGVSEIKQLLVMLPAGILLLFFSLKWIKFGGGIKDATKDVILLFGLSLPFIIIHIFLSIKSSSYLPLIPKEDIIKKIYLKIFR